MRRICTDADRRLMAEAYLLWGTVRLAAIHTGWSKSTVHRIVREFIKNGDFRDTYALIELVAKNTREAPVRGGRSSAKKKKEIRR